VRGDKANTRLELKNMVQQYLLSEEKNDRSNFENAVYSIKMFSELGWSFQEYLISFEEMVLTLRKKLIKEANGKSLSSTNREEEEMVSAVSALKAVKDRDFLNSTNSTREEMAVVITQNVIDKNSESLITSNCPEIRNSYRQVRKFIKTFSSNIFDMFKSFHDDPASNLLKATIQRLWPQVTISEEEMEELILVLSQCIGKVTAEDSLFINLSGEGFLKLREQLFKVLSSKEVWQHFKEGAKTECIKFLELSVSREI
jgi:hypothetical protein